MVTGPNLHFDIIVYVITRSTRADYNKKVGISPTSLSKFCLTFLRKKKEKILLESKGPGPLLNFFCFAITFSKGFFFLAIDKLS